MASTAADAGSKPRRRLTLKKQAKDLAGRTRPTLFLTAAGFYVSMATRFYDGSNAFA
jgi:hypothetical protein